MISAGICMTGGAAGIIGRIKAARKMRTTDTPEEMMTASRRAHMVGTAGIGMVRSVGGKTCAATRVLAGTMNTAGCMMEAVTTIMVRTIGEDDLLLGKIKNKTSGSSSFSAGDFAVSSRDF
jgi:predicted ribonuclease toxin of YeeF-YezG toxin-antitoxin module